MKKINKLIIILALFLTTFSAVQAEENSKLKNEKIIDNALVKSVQITNPDSELLIKIQNLNNEEERQKIFSEYYPEKNNELIKAKSKEIFTDYDILFANLDKVKAEVENNYLILNQNSNINLDDFKLKIDDLKNKFSQAKKYRVNAWIVFNKIDLNAKEADILSDIEKVRNYLVLTKNIAKDISIDLKEDIYFLKGIVLNLK